MLGDPLDRLVDALWSGLRSGFGLGLGRWLKRLGQRLPIGRRTSVVAQRPDADAGQATAARKGILRGQGLRGVVVGLAPDVMLSVIDGYPGGRLDRVVTLLRAAGHLDPAHPNG